MTVSIDDRATAATAPVAEPTWQQQRAARLFDAGLLPCAQAAVEIAGPLRARDLRAAAARVVARYPVLWNANGAGMPSETRRHDMALESWAECDGSHVSNGAREAMRARCRRNDRRVIARPEAHSLFQLRLLRWDDDRHELVATISGRAADAHAVNLLCAEISRVYGGEHASGQALTYAAVVEWEQTLRESEEGEEGRLFWNLVSSPDEGEHEMPFERRVPESQPYDAGFVFVEPSCLDVDGLASAARAHGIAAPVLLLTCWHVLCSRLTRAKTTVGVTLPGRTYPELADVVGPLDRTVPFGVAMRPSTTIAEAFAAVARWWQGAIEWQDCFASSGEQEPGRVYAFGFAHVDWQGAWTNGSSDTCLTPFIDTVGARLTLLSCEANATRVLALQFDRRAFTATAVKRLAASFAAIVNDAVRRRHATVDDLALLTETEHAQVVREWNATGVEWPAAVGDTLVAWLERQAAATPDAIAVWSEDAQWSYTHLHATANRLARRLQRLGVGTDARVALWLGRTPHMVAAVLGVLKAGGAYVPLDPTYPAARLTMQVADADVRVVLTEEAHVAAVPAGGYAIEVVDAADAPWRTEAATPLDTTIVPTQLAYIIYTSGSTGVPKGAMNAHAGVLNRLVWMQARYELTGADRVLQKTSISFDVSVWELFLPLGTGAALVLARPGGAPDPVYLATLVAQAGVTVAHFVPAMLEAFVTARGLAGCAGVRLLCTSGEALPGPLAGRVQAAWNGQLENLYGPTEAAVDVSWQPCGPVETSCAIVPIGRPVANTQLYVVDGAGQTVPVGVVGDLLIGGVQVGRGYWTRPALTAERFVPDPFGDRAGARVYRSGDLARYRPDGTVEYVGRADHQVKLRGFRIELGDIEAALRQHPSVRDAVVLLREDRPGDPRLVAYIVVAGRTPDFEEWRQHLASRIPDYMAPSALVALDALPLMPNGKIDRRSLPEPTRAAHDGRDSHVPTQMEEIVCGIWSEVLGVDLVGVHDNFLELGGHSLNAVQVLVRLREALGREIPLSTLFERSTPAALAEELSMLSPEGMSQPALEPVDREGPLPLSFGQERLWVIDQVTGTRAYHVPLALQVTGPVDPRALRAALCDLAARHEVLRTTIDVVDAEPVQRIAPLEAVPLPWVDVSAVASGAQSRMYARVQHQFEGAAFDLQRGPLWRVAMLRVSPEQHVFICTLHHIVADGWSLGILLRDVTVLYEAARTGEPADLPTLPVQYVDFAQWQRRAIAGQGTAPQLAYWRTQLADLAPLALPTDRPRRPMRSGRGGVVSRQWPAPLTARVHQSGRAQGATLFMVLLAGWQALLARYAGQRDVAVGVPVAQRPRAELENLVGFFLNTIVVRTEVAGSESWRTLVSQVRTQALGAYAHQLVPFEHVIAALQPDRDLARTPFFQAMFVLQNNPHVSVAGADSVRFQPRVTYERVPKYELTLHAVPKADGLAWMLQYDADLFDADTMERQMDHFERLVESLLDAPDRPIGALSMLSEAERRQICAPASSVQPWSIEQSISTRFDDVAHNAPEGMAVKTPGASWTYAELSAHSHAAARAIQAAVPGDGTRIALLCGHGEKMLAAMMGVLTAGHAYVPMDPRAPLDRLRHVWTDADASAILCDPLYRELAEQIAGDRPVSVLDLDAPSCSARPAGISPDQIAYLLYTSGSTGRPKGVVQNHRNVLHFARTYAGRLGLRRDDRVSLLPAYGSDAAVMDIFGALLTGAALYPIDLRSTSLPELADWIDSEAITVLHATPTVFRLLVGSLGPGRVLATVRLVVLGGEAAYRADAEAFSRHFSSTCVLVNGLGPTESTLALQHRVTGTSQSTRHALPAGHPVDATAVHLVDEDGFDAEVFGEIVVESPHVALEYWRKPELTRVAFKEPSNAKGPRRYRTGDLGRRLPDGSVEFLGRRDRQIKVHGHRVELGEIEMVLKTHHAVRDVTVSIWRDDAKQESLVAYVVPHGAVLANVAGTAQPSSTELRALVASRLPDHMVPAAFVMLEALPLRANGKIDTDALPPPSSFPASRRPYVAPEGELEQQLAEGWMQVLSLARVGRDDNFFELGGDSIRAIRFAARAQASGLPLTPLLVFQHPTVADLATALGVQIGSREPALPPAETPAEPELTPSQLTFLSSRVQLEG